MVNTTKIQNKFDRVAWSVLFKVPLPILPIEKIIAREVIKNPRRQIK